MEEQISEIWYVHPMKYCSVLKVEEILTYTTEQKYFEDIMPSEISQSQILYVKFHECDVPRAVKLRDKKQNELLGAVGKGEMGDYCLMATELQFFVMRRVLDMYGGDGTGIE